MFKVLYPFVTPGVPEVAPVDAIDPVTHAVGDEVELPEADAVVLVKYGIVEADASK